MELDRTHAAAKSQAMLLDPDMRVHQIARRICTALVPNAPDFVALYRAHLTDSTARAIHDLVEVGKGVLRTDQHRDASIRFNRSSDYGIEADSLLSDIDLRTYRANLPKFSA